MSNRKIVCVIGLIVLLAVSGLAIEPVSISRVSDDIIAPPTLPSPACDELQVPAGNEVAFHTYAVGVQVYKWNGVSWVFVEPVANLFADSNYQGQVGTHYAGPTWKSNSGSNVVGKRLIGCSVDSTAIDWLKLQTVSTGGSGIFNGVTYIQRVNTVGGKAPTTPGTFVGAEAKIPYTAEYYFYRAED